MFTTETQPFLQPNAEEVTKLQQPILILALIYMLYPNKTDACMNECVQISLDTHAQTAQE